MGLSAPCASLICGVRGLYAGASVLEGADAQEALAGQPSLPHLFGFAKVATRVPTCLLCAKGLTESELADIAGAELFEQQQRQQQQQHHHHQQDAAQDGPTPQIGADAKQEAGLQQGLPHVPQVGHDSQPEGAAASHNARPPPLMPLPETEVEFVPETEAPAWTLDAAQQGAVLNQALHDPRPQCEQPGPPLPAPVGAAAAAAAGATAARVQAAEGDKLAVEGSGDGEALRPAVPGAGEATAEGPLLPSSPQLPAPPLPACAPASQRAATPTGPTSVPLPTLSTPAAPPLAVGAAGQAAAATEDLEGGPQPTTVAGGVRVGQAAAGVGEEVHGAAGAQGLRAGGQGAGEEGQLEVQQGVGMQGAREPGTGPCRVAAQPPGMPPQPLQAQEQPVPPQLLQPPLARSPAASLAQHGPLQAAAPPQPVAATSPPPPAAQPAPHPRGVGPLPAAPVPDPLPAQLLPALAPAQSSSPAALLPHALQHAGALQGLPATQQQGKADPLGAAAESPGEAAAAAAAAAGGVGTCGCATTHTPPPQRLPPPKRQKFEPPVCTHKPANASSELSLHQQAQAPSLPPPLPQPPLPQPQPPSPVCAGCRTLTGKQVAINPEARRRVLSLFDEPPGEQQPSQPLQPQPPSPVCAGFRTLTGKQVAINPEARRRAMSLFDERPGEQQRKQQEQEGALGQEVQLPGSLGGCCHGLYQGRRHDGDEDGHGGSGGGGVVGTGGGAAVNAAPPCPLQGCSGEGGSCDQVTGGAGVGQVSAAVGAVPAGAGEQEGTAVASPVLGVRPPLSHELVTRVPSTPALEAPPPYASPAAAPHAPSHPLAAPSPLASTPAPHARALPVQAQTPSLEGLNANGSSLRNSIPSLAAKGARR